MHHILLSCPSISFSSPLCWLLSFKLFLQPSVSFSSCTSSSFEWRLWNWKFLANMTQKAWTYRKFNRRLRGSNNNVFVQTKYEHDQYDEPNIITPNSWHDNVERKIKQISNIWLNHTMLMHMMQLGGYVEGMIGKKKWWNKIWTW